MSTLRETYQEIAKNKKHDYTDLSGVEAIENAVDTFGETAWDMMFKIKLSRLESILFKSARVEESFSETLGDLCAYIAMYIQKNYGEDGFEDAFNPHFVLGFMQSRGLSPIKIVQMKIFSYLMDLSPTFNASVNGDIKYCTHEGKSYYVNCPYQADIFSHVEVHDWKFGTKYITSNAMETHNLLNGSLFRSQGKLLYVMKRESQLLYSTYDVTSDIYKPDSLLVRYLKGEANGVSLYSYFSSEEMYTVTALHPMSYVPKGYFDGASLVANRMELNNING